MRTILYIGGHPDGVELSKALPTPASRRMIFAATGEDGLALAREHLPDLILLDPSLADLAGLAVLDPLREDAATEAIPVVLMPVDLAALPALVERSLSPPQSRSWRCTACAAVWLRPLRDAPGGMARCIRCDGPLTPMDPQA